MGKILFTELYINNKCNNMRVMRYDYRNVTCVRVSATNSH